MRASRADVLGPLALWLSHRARSDETLDSIRAERENLCAGEFARGSMSPKKKKTKKKTKSAREPGAWRIWFYEAADGNTPGLEFLSEIPREPRETLYAVNVAVSDRPPRRSFSTAMPVWSALERRGKVDLRGIYEACGEHGKTLFRLFCVLDREADEHDLGAPALVVLSGERSPVGAELPASVYRRVRAEADRYFATSPRPVARAPRKI